MGFQVWARVVAGGLLCGLLGCSSKPSKVAPEPPPVAVAWAYPELPKGAPETTLGPGTYLTPDGRRLTGKQIDDLEMTQVDWFPDQHPAPPTVVIGPHAKDGPEPCSGCHMIAGQGVANIPDLAGLRSAYILQQLHAFQSGERRSAQPDRLATAAMIEVAKGWSEADLTRAAEYFAALPRRPRVEVREAETAPLAAVERFGWAYALPGHARQPLAGHVVELTEDLPALFMHDPRGRLSVYAPLGTLAAGEAVVKRVGCPSCHGSDLRGRDEAPPLSGRSPSYLARMLWDIRSGSRTGAAVAPMQGLAKQLSPQEITEVSVYLASLPV